MYEGRFMVADATDEEGNKYHFICFRGTTNFEDWKRNGDVRPAMSSIGVVHAGFLDRSQAVPLLSILQALGSKRVVICGHSLGGACATLLAARFFAEHGEFSYDDNQINCITFGSPLVGGPALGEYMFSKKRHFHNYINGSDCVPRIMTVMDVILPAVSYYAISALSYLSGTLTNVLEDVTKLSYLKPFGNYYMVDSGTSHLKCRTMDYSDIKSYFEDDTSNRKVSDRMLVDHSMSSYKNSLVGTVGAQPVPTGVSLPRLIEMMECTPQLSFVSLRDQCLCVHGCNLIYTSRGDVMGEILSLESADNYMAIFTCSKAMFARLLDMCSRKAPVDIVISTMFGTTSSDGPIPCRVQNSKKLLTPDKVLASVLPLVTSLVRSQSPNGAKMESKMDEMYAHCVALGHSVPIEFAFRTMELCSEDVNSVVVTAFLNRFKQVTIDWRELCSEVMLETIQNSIKRLTDGSLNEDQVLARYKHYNDAFGHVVATDAHTSNPNFALVKYYDSIYIGHDSSKMDFWNFVCQENISCAIDVRFKAEGSLTPFMPVKGETLLVYGFRVRLHYAKASELHKFEEYMIEFPASNKKTFFYLFSYVWSPDLLSDILTLLLTWYKIIFKEPNKCIINDTDSVSSPVAIVLFLFALRTLSPRDQKNELEHSRLLYELSLKFETFEVAPSIVPVVCDANECANQSTNLTPSMFQLEFLLSGRSVSSTKASNILNGLCEAMTSNYEIVDSPFLCGRSIMMEVVDNFDTTEKTPFLDLFPKLLDSKALEMTTLSRRIELMSYAAEASAKAKYLTIILEDAMKYGDKAMEVERSVPGRIGMSLVAAMKSVAVVPYGALKSVQAVVAQKFSHIIDVQMFFENAWHTAFYDATSFTSYPDIVQKMCERLGMSDFARSSLADQERFVVHTLPKEVKTSSLEELIRKRTEVFKDSKFLPLLQGRSSGLIIFFLKIIYHCQQLRILRQSVTIVTISGLQNAGKTTLVKKIFGKDVVKGKNGVGSLNTTIFPSGYFSPDEPSTIFCDLPGCNDSDTASMAKMFMCLGDVTVFIYDQNSPKNPDGSSIHDILAGVLNSTGPRLICINGVDRIFNRDDDEDEDENYAALSAEECEHLINVELECWRASTLFKLKSKVKGTQFTSEMWPCETEKQGAVVASVRDAHSAISIWLTSFNPQGTNKDLAKSLLFSGADVLKWVQQAKTLAAIYSLE
jgi:hypothetical protein